MAKRSKTSSLDVYVGTSKVGLYVRERSGATSFRYDPKWLGSKKAFPISLSMPLSSRVWKGKECSAYFDGLLPDLEEIRSTIAAREHADSANTFDLLAVIGRDCVGALRFIPTGEDPGDPTHMKSRLLKDRDIEERLKKLGSSPLGMIDEDEGFRISLAGAQEKTAFLLHKGKWRLPIGATPTSHIFKPPIERKQDGIDLSDSHWNEWICLELCREYGLKTAKSKVLKFGKKEVIVIERFDREWKDGVLYRRPQEDLCQALGVSPDKKYQSHGGPKIIDILKFLDGSSSPYEDRLSFFKAQVLNWVLGATDGHAKNYSIELSASGFRLAPLYDIMSVYPYRLPQNRMKLAMSIGNNNRYIVDRIIPRHFYQTAQKGGIKKEDIDKIFHEIHEGTHAALSKVSKKISKTSAPKKTFNRITEGIETRLRNI